MKKAFSLIELSIVILIIGILVAGVTQGSRLIKEFKISNARNLTRSSPVASVSGLIAWWESTAENSFSANDAEDEATISTWYDINPQAIMKMDMSQSVAGNRPFYDEAIINGLPAVRFNGSNRYFERAYTAELNPNNFTIFAVTKVAGLANFGTIFSSRNGGTIGGYILYAHPNSATPASSFNLWIGNGSNWGTSFNQIAITIDQTYLITQKYNGSTVTAYNAGSLVGSRAEPTLLLNQIHNSRIGAGRNETTPDFFLNGHIGEIIIFNRALKNEERESVEEYLGKKWGIDIN